MINQPPVGFPSRGKFYIFLIAVSKREKGKVEEEFVEFHCGGEMLYQTIVICEEKNVYEAFNS